VVYYKGTGSDVRAGRFLFWEIKYKNSALSFKNNIINLK